MFCFGLGTFSPYLMGFISDEILRKFQEISLANTPASFLLVLEDTVKRRISGILDADFKSDKIWR